MTASDCLTPDELAALASGRLAGEALDRAAAHVDVCPACLAAVPASGPDDPLVAVLCLDAALAAGAAAGPAGRYEVIRLHAAGGLGEVHVAEDTELGRTVALKRLRPARADDPASRRRFLREAAITARLEHPGVVPVHGLVRDPAGRPHYAMRLVAGQSLQDAIRSLHAAGRPDPLALRGLLTRFVAVCQTIAYAHSKGVVHRDLKPANVMLGEYGETLVVDWGLAKVLGGNEPAEAAGDRPDPTDTLHATETRTGAAVGTPGYMSPEQADGRTADVGPASDVYALGATLHAILTGRPPKDSPRRADRAMPRALLAVCRKATAERPADRYASAAELGAEVERWLAGEPVAAYPEGWAARALRWARRHRVVVAAALVTAVVGGTVGAWGFREAADRRAEQRRLERKDAEAVDRALAAVPGLVAGWRFSEAVGLLEQTRLGLSEFAADETRHRLEEALGDVRLAETLDAVRLEQSEMVDGRLPDPARAASRSEAAFRDHGLDCAGGDARELGARLARSVVRDALVGALDDWAYGERDRARREAVTRVARAADPDPWRDSFRDALARVGRARVKELAAGADVIRLAPPTVVTLGRALGSSTPEAEALFRAAQPLHPTDFWINCYLGLAVYSHAADRDGAARAVSYDRACLAVRPNAAAVHNNLALALHKAGDFAAAAAAGRRAVELQPNSANGWNTLATALSAGGDKPGAEAAYRRAIELTPAFAVAHRNLGIVLRARGDWAGSEKAYRRAIVLDPKDAKAHNNLGNLLLDRGNAAEAEKEFRRALDLDPRFAAAHNNLGRAVHTRGDTAGAEAEIRKALELDPAYPDAHNNLGNLFHERGNAAGAEREYHRTIELDPRHALAHFNIAQALAELGRFDEARAAAEWAVGLFPPGRPDHARAERRLQFCERLLALDRRLTAILRGDDDLPDHLGERLGLAEVAAFKQRFAVAARLYDELFSRYGPPPSPVRTGAACAAALAGCGKGTDDANAAERARWRQRALEWLRAELRTQTLALAADTPMPREQARGVLRRWQSDVRLAGVRDATGLAALPPDERTGWRQFWADVEAALEPGEK